jgi:hypothetical protein
LHDANKKHGADDFHDGASLRVYLFAERSLTSSAETLRRLYQATFGSTKHIDDERYARDE